METGPVSLLMPWWPGPSQRTKCLNVYVLCSAFMCRRTRKGRFSVHKTVPFFKLSADTKQGPRIRSPQGFVAQPKPNIGRAAPQAAQLNDIITEGLAKGTTMGKGWVHDTYMLPTVPQIVYIEFRLTNKRVTVTAGTSNK